MKQTDFEFEEVYNLTRQIDEAATEIHYRDILTNENGGVTLLAFRQGQKLPSHLAPGDVMVYVLGGKLEFTFDKSTREISHGEFMLIKEGVAHKVEAKSYSKVMLVKIKS